MTQPCGGVVDCVWTVEDCAVGSRWQASWMLTYNLCKRSRSETQSLDRSRGAKAKLGGQLVSFYKLKQSPSSYLGLEDAALYLQCMSCRAWGAEVLTQLQLLIIICSGKVTLASSLWAHLDEPPRVTRALVLPAAPAKPWWYFIPAVR